MQTMTDCRDFEDRLAPRNREKLCEMATVDLGVQQCFGVVYHELTTLRRFYFARAALAVRAK